MAAEKNPFAKFLTHFNKGNVLFHEGDDGEEMYIIQSGKVAIKKKVKMTATPPWPCWRRATSSARWRILERLPRSASAPRSIGGRATSSSSAATRFGDMIKTNPEIAVRMLRKQSIRLRETEQAARAA